MAQGHAALQGNKRLARVPSASFSSFLRFICLVELIDALHVHHFVTAGQTRSFPIQAGGQFQLEGCNVEDTHASYAGKRGGIARLLDASDGHRLQELRFDAAPVWDGIAKGLVRLPINVMPIRALVSDCVAAFARMRAESPRSDDTATDDRDGRFDLPAF